MNDIEVFLRDFLDEFADINVADYSKDANLVELNLLDSMIWMNLIMQIDEVFNVEMDIEELIEKKSFCQICVYIEREICASKD